MLRVLFLQGVTKEQTIMDSMEWWKLKNKIQIPVILINCGKEIKRPFNIAPTLAARDCGGGEQQRFYRSCRD